MSASSSQTSTADSGSKEDEDYPSSSSATEATRASSSEASASSSAHSASRSSSRASASSSSSSSSASASRSPSSAPSSQKGRKGQHGRDDTFAAPFKLPRLEEEVRPLQAQERRADGDGPLLVSSAPTVGTSASIFPAPPPSVPPASFPAKHPLATPPPPYGSIFPRPPSGAWATPPAPAPTPSELPTLSAAAKDISEMDARAGLRLGVFRSPTRLNKEQVLDEIESVRMTSQVERVLLEAAQSLTMPDVSPEEREYAWAMVFFASAEAAELCAARLCQPGRRSKWARVCIQRLPLVTPVTHPLSQEEEQRFFAHQHQLEPTTAATVPPALPDTVLAHSAHGWSVLSTAALFPTSGLLNYQKHRRRGDCVSVDVCAGFDPVAAYDACLAGGLCTGLHLRSLEQWKLLLPVMLPAKGSGSGASTPIKQSSASSAATAASGAQYSAETAWQKKRHADCLVVKSVPADVDEEAFVYMFRQCDGFMRAQTVRTADQQRYGVVQFATADSAQRALQQATANAKLKIRYFGREAGESEPRRAAGESGGAACNENGSSSGATVEHRSAPSAVVDVAAEQNGNAAAPAAAAAASSVVSGATHAPGVPFPPLPDGWEYGLSRRTMQYYFLQSGKKSTTWKHPTTQEQYKAKR